MTAEAGSAFKSSEEICSEALHESNDRIQGGHRNDGDNSLTLLDHEGDNLPPLEFEPGVVGTAQKGVSLLVAVFGAAAFAACAYGLSLALFPSPTST